MRFSRSTLPERARKRFQRSATGRTLRLTLLVTIVGLLPPAGALAQNGDYLTPDLRARVE